MVGLFYFFDYSIFIMHAFLKNPMYKEYILLTFLLSSSKIMLYYSYPENIKVQPRVSKIDFCQSHCNFKISLIVGDIRISCRKFQKCFVSFTDVLIFLPPIKLTLKVPSCHLAFSQKRNCENFPEALLQQCSVFFSIKGSFLEEEGKQQFCFRHSLVSFAKRKYRFSSTLLVPEVLIISEVSANHPGFVN